MGCQPHTETEIIYDDTPNSDVQMSQNFLISLKNNENTDDFIRQLADLEIDALASSLNTSDKKLAFWMNIYNALVQHRLIDDITQFEDRDAFFTKPFVDIGGVMMSFDDIEHGIIRNSRVKLGLGYLKDLFVPAWEKKLRNTKREGRVHFALNCGARTCPPVAIYEASRLDEQLSLSAKKYLETVTEVSDGTITTSPLFSWFRGDFGGKSGMKKLLISLGVITSDQSDYSLEFGDYDWTADIGNYIDL